MASSSKQWIMNVVCDSFVTAWNFRTGEIRNIGFLSTPGTFQFLDSIPKHFDMKNVKVILFTIAEHLFPNSRLVYTFGLKCREFCQKHATFCYIQSMNQTAAFLALSKTQTMVEEGEIVLLVISIGPIPERVLLKRENNRYKILIEGQSMLRPFSPPWKAEILGSLKPKKIILMKYKEEVCPGPPHDIQQMKDCFINENIQVFYPEYAGFNLITGREIALQLMNEKGPTVYDVATPALCKFEVRLGGKVIIKVTEANTVPFEESVTVDVDPKSNITLYCKYGDVKAFEAVREIKCSSYKSQKVKITLKIDYNSFDDLKVEQIKDENEPVEPEKTRIVFDKQNFTVSYFAGGNENILYDKDGLDKTSIYISFVEEKPVIGKVAKESYTDKPKYVVFDLIKLCSTTDADIVNPKWGFSLSRDNESIMVTLQTLNGERRSSVAFLLALILKSGISRIYNHYGKKMNELEIGVDGFVPNETLKKNFIEAGNLLNIGIVFV